MPEALPDLTPETFEAFMDRLRQDPVLKIAVAQGITERGFVAVLEEFFQLSDRQKKLLQPLRSGRGAAAHWENALTTTLISGGDISLVHEGRNSTDIELEVSIGIVSIDISIHC